MDTSNAPSVNGSQVTRAAKRKRPPQAGSSASPPPRPVSGDKEGASRRHNPDRVVSFGGSKTPNKKAPQRDTATRARSQAIEKVRVPEAGDIEVDLGAEELQAVRAAVHASRVRDDALAQELASTTSQSGGCKQGTGGKDDARAGMATRQHVQGSLVPGQLAGAAGASGCAHRRQALFGNAQGASFDGLGLSQVGLSECMQSRMSGYIVLLIFAKQLRASFSSLTRGHCCSL